MRDYLDLLGRADAWYRGVKARFPDKVPCERGCRDCCLGLFDISPADAELLREGLAGLDPAARRDVEARAEALAARLRAVDPRLGEDLDGRSPEEIDRLAEALGPAECPALGPQGECRLYAHRPLICRLSGAPLVDVSGEAVFPEGCARCTLAAEEAPRLDCGALRRDERRILRRRYRGRSGVTLFIPQALAPPARPGPAGRA